MSMDTEEMIRAQPVDACVMVGGMYSFPVPLRGLGRERGLPG